MTTENLITDTATSRPRRSEAPGSSDGARGSRLASGWVVLVVAALVCWTIAAVGLKSAKEADYGLLQAANPLLGASIVLTIAAFLFGVRARIWSAVVSSTVCLIVIERLTTTVGTDIPLYPWTYKHLAVVAYIQRYGGVERGVDIYHRWPGMFSATAWLSNLTGVSPTTIAHWFTPVIHVLGALAVYALARAWGTSALAAASATFLWEALSFLAQDYFSPQAIAYLLGIGVLICFGLARTHRAFVYLTPLIFAGVTITHQLSPYWILLTAFALLVFRRLRPWWIPVLLAAIAGGYLLWNYAAVRDYGGAVSGNLASNVFPSAQSNDVLAAGVAFRLTEFIYALMFLSAAAVFLVGWRRKQDVLGAGILTFSVLLLLAQSYGGEAIFRVFVYALPGAAVLIAPALNRLLQARVTRMSLAAALVTVACLASAQSYFAGWFGYRVTKGEIAANHYFAAHAVGASYLTSVPPGWPSLDTFQYAFFGTQQANYTASVFTANTRIKADLGSSAEYDKVMTVLQSRKKLPTYLVLSDRDQYYGWFVGVLPKDGLTRLETKVSSDPRWQLAFTSGDARVYTLTP